MIRKPVKHVKKMKNNLIIKYFNRQLYFGSIIFLIPKLNICCLLSTLIIYFNSFDYKILYFLSLYLILDLIQLKKPNVTNILLICEKNITMSKLVKLFFFILFLNTTGNVFITLSSKEQISLIILFICCCIEYIGIVIRIIVDKYNIIINNIFEFLASIIYSRILISAGLLIIISTLDLMDIELTKEYILPLIRESFWVKLINNSFILEIILWINSGSSNGGSSGQNNPNPNPGGSNPGGPNSNNNNLTYSNPDDVNNRRRRHDIGQIPFSDHEEFAEYITRRERAIVGEGYRRGGLDLYIHLFNPDYIREFRVLKGYPVSNTSISSHRSSSVNINSPNNLPTNNNSYSDRDNTNNNSNLLNSNVPNNRGLLNNNNVTTNSGLSNSNLPINSNLNKNVSTKGNLSNNVPNNNLSNNVPNNSNMLNNNVSNSSLSNRIITLSKKYPNINFEGLNIFGKSAVIGENTGLRYKRESGGWGEYYTNHYHENNLDLYDKEEKYVKTVSSNPLLDTSPFYIKRQGARIILTKECVRRESFNNWSWNKNMICFEYPGPNNSRREVQTNLKIMNKVPILKS